MDERAIASYASVAEDVEWIDHIIKQVILADNHSSSRWKLKSILRGAFLPIFDFRYVPRDN